MTFWDLAGLALLVAAVGPAALDAARARHAARVATGQPWTEDRLPEDH